MVNKQVQEAFKKSGVYKWKVAELLGIADTTFSKKLRRELSQDTKTQILNIINDLSQKKVGVN